MRRNIFASELYLFIMSGGPIIMLNRRCEILSRQPIGGGRGVNWGHHQPMTGRLSIWGVLLLWRGTTEVQRLSVHTEVKCYLHKTVEFTLHCGEVKSELCGLWSRLTIFTVFTTHQHSILTLPQWSQDTTWTERRCVEMWRWSGKYFYIKWINGNGG